MPKVGSSSLNISSIIAATKQAPSSGSSFSIRARGPELSTASAGSGNTANDAVRQSAPGVSLRLAEKNSANGNSATFDTLQNRREDIQSIQNGSSSEQLANKPASVTSLSSNPPSQPSNSGAAASQSRVSSPSSASSEKKSKTKSKSDDSIQVDVGAAVKIELRPESVLKQALKPGGAVKDPGALNNAADILKAAAPKSVTLKPSGSVDTKQLHAAAETLSAAAPKPATLRPGTDAPSTKVTRAEAEIPEEPTQVPAISVKA